MNARFQSAATPAAKSAASASLKTVVSAVCAT